MWNVKRRTSTLASRATSLALAAALLAGCGGSDEASPANPPAPSDDVRVIQPGAPGEPNEKGPVTVEPNESNHADIAFMQQMVPHHAQAIEMAKLAPARAQDPGVRRLADRIRDAQGPEILTMASWLDSHGIEVPRAGEDMSRYDHGMHGHDGMLGMMSPEQMDALAAADGAQFDRLFLAGMIRHHQGAIDMAETAAVDGTDLQVQEIAAEVATGQRAEIDRMRDLRQQL